MKRLYDNQIKEGDYIYLPYRKEYLKIVCIDGGYNAIDENGEYATRYYDGTPDTSEKNLKRYIESWYDVHFPHDVVFLRLIN